MYLYIYIYICISLSASVHAKTATKHTSCGDLSIRAANKKMLHPYFLQFLK